MRAATAVSSMWRAYALAFGLSLAIVGMGAGLAHAQSTEPAGPTQVAQGLLAPAPDNSFVCHAQPGGWCDLRDWAQWANNPINQSVN